MRTLTNYIPLLLCPAMMVACIAGPRLFGRKSCAPAAAPAAPETATPTSKPGSDPALSELAELRAEVARLRTMVTPTITDGEAHDAVSTPGSVERG